MSEPIGVSLAKKAYAEGRIALDVLDEALEDRLVGNRHAHDERIDGFVPRSARGESYEPYAYGEEGGDE